MAVTVLKISKYIRGETNRIPSYDPSHEGTPILMGDVFKDVQNLAGCAGGGKKLIDSLTPRFGIADSKGDLEFNCPKCGAGNLRPYGGFISNCQSCGSDEVSCEKPKSN